MTDDLRTQIRRALAEADGFDFDSLEPHDYQQHADKVLALVQPIADQLAFTSTDRLKLTTMDRDSWQQLADLTRQRAERAEAERDKLKAEFARIQTPLDGDDLPLLCPDCVCEDCGGRLGQHAPGGNCSCGCNPPCDRFIEDPQLDLIAEAARPMTGSPLSEAVAHATWHALQESQR